MRHKIIFCMIALGLSAATAHAQWGPWGPIPGPPPTPTNNGIESKPERITGTAFRKMTTTWKYWEPVGGGGPAVPVTESCNKCSGHVHNPGGPDKKGFSGVDSNGNTKAAGQEFERVDKNPDQFKEGFKPWHVDANEKGERTGDWFPSATATEVEMRHTWEEEATGNKWNKVAKSDKWEKRTFAPVKNIKAPVIIWNDVTKEKCPEKPPEKKPNE